MIATPMTASPTPQHDWGPKAVAPCNESPGGVVWMRFCRRCGDMTNSGPSTPAMWELFLRCGPCGEALKEASSA